MSNCQNIEKIKVFSWLTLLRETRAEHIQRTKTAQALCQQIGASSRHRSRVQKRAGTSSHHRHRTGKRGRGDQSIGQDPGEAQSRRN